MTKRTPTDRAAKEPIPLQPPWSPWRELAPLEVTAEPPPPPAAELPPEPAPEAMPPAPDLELAGEEKAPLDKQELVALCGGLFVLVNNAVSSRLFPEAPLSADEQQALSSSGGALLAHYMPDDLDGVWLLWGAALGTMTAIYMPRVLERRKKATDAGAGSPGPRPETIREEHPPQETDARLASV